MISKFEAGFAARLHEALALLPELFDLDVVSAEYARLAALDPTATRAATWHQAITRLLATLSDARSITRTQQAEIRAGIDSLAGLLDALLWSSPTVSDTRGASPEEAEALADVVARMDADPGIFTRYFGAFDGRPVVNYCPGAPFARLFLQQGWTICTREIHAAS